MESYPQVKHCRVFAASFINLFRQKMRTKKEQIIDSFVTEAGAQFCNGTSQVP
jgi:hypothetical protein